MMVHCGHRRMRRWVDEPAIQLYVASHLKIADRLHAADAPALMVNTPAATKRGLVSDLDAPRILGKTQELTTLPGMREQSGLGKKCSHDGVDVRARSIQMRKVGIPRMEDQGEIGSGEKDCIKAPAQDEPMRQGA
jgi:hypothetical protein